MTRIQIATCCLFACTRLLHSDGIHLSGTITNRAVVGLPGVEVALVRAGTTGRSDAQGQWVLGTTSVGSGFQRGSAIEWTGRAVVLDLITPSPVMVEIFDLHGDLLGRTTSAVLDAGVRSMPVDLKGPGIKVLKVSAGGRTMGMVVANGLACRPREAQPSSSETGRVLTIADTIRFTWRTRVVAEIPISNLDTSGIVVRIGTDSSVAWNETVAYGNLYDSRDGQVYRTVKIAGQTWMAENFNYDGMDSWWSKGSDHSLPDGKDGYLSIDDSITHGAKYGRLYTWASAMALPSKCNSEYCITPDSCSYPWKCSPSVFPRVQGICPAGWHFPSDTEWTALFQAVEKDPRVGSGKAATALESRTGWASCTCDPGTDVFGFHAVPAGAYSTAGNTDIGYQCLWWTASEYRQGDAWMHDMAHGGGVTGRYDDWKGTRYSVRCTRD